MHSIHLEASPSYAPKSNGVAERLIQEHWTRNRTLLFASNLPNIVWGEACTFLIGREIDDPTNEF